MIKPVVTPVSPDPLTVHGRVHSIETFGTVDGPGTRLVVFCQGCPMRCAYCHNPDTWEFGRADGSGPGTDVTVAQILEKFECNRPFYRRGGITVTGGEPMAQPEFVTALFRAAHDAPAGRIHTCLDTSGATFSALSRPSAFSTPSASSGSDASGESDTSGESNTPSTPSASNKPNASDIRGTYSTCLSDLLDVCDLVLLDIKTSDVEQHKRLCGLPASHARELGNELARRRIPVVIRHVVVPGITDTDEELAGVGRIIARWPNVIGLDVLPYHTMGEKKYQELGIPYPLKGVPAMDAKRVPELRSKIMAARATEIRRLQSKR